MKIVGIYSNDEQFCMWSKNGTKITWKVWKNEFQNKSKAVLPHPSLNFKNTIYMLSRKILVIPGQLQYNHCSFPQKP